MIAEGCVMARVCHTNNCPVGVATQKENLRKRFTGIPEHVVNFFWYVAEEVRQLMSLLGVARLEELIGRTDLLQAARLIWPRPRVWISPACWPRSAAPKIALGFATATRPTATDRSLRISSSPTLN